MAVSKRLRFEVLRRDNHTCRYCGGIAPDVTLTVDHVVPVALGGSDDPANLVAACKDCNAGKTSSNPDASLVDDVAQDAMRWAAAMRQAADEFSDEIQSRTDAYAAVDAEWHQGNRPNDWTDSIDQFIKAGLPLDVIVKMAGVAQNKRGAMGYRWSYFCGCCWTRIREMRDRAETILAHQAHQETAAQHVAEPEPTGESDLAQLFEPSETSFGSLFAGLFNRRPEEDPYVVRQRERYQAMKACTLCDDDGYIGKSVCSHDDYSAIRAGRAQEVQRQTLKERLHVIDGGVDG